MVECVAVSVGGNCLAASESVDVEPVDHYVVLYAVPTVVISVVEQTAAHVKRCVFVERRLFHAGRNHVAQHVACVVVRHRLVALFAAAMVADVDIFFPVYVEIDVDPLSLL